MEKICQTCGKKYQGRNLYYCNKKCSATSTIKIDEEKFIKLYNENLNYEKMAEKLLTNRLYIMRKAQQLITNGVIKKRSLKKYIDPDKLLTLYNKHRLTINQIAKYFGVSYVTIDNRLNELKNKGEYVRTVYVSVGDDELIELYRTYKGSHQKIANHYSCHRSTIHKHLQRLHSEGKLPEYGSHERKTDTNYRRTMFMYTKKNQNLIHGRKS